MIIGFSKHGLGVGSGPVDYLTAGMPISYMLNDNNKHGEKRDPAPELLRGNPTKTRDLIDSLTFKYHYTSGVLSFAPEDQVSPTREKDIMDTFESTAFAGLERNQYDILWIRHTHTGRHEMHFLVPRCELRTGKSLNISPPHSRPLFDSLRSTINLRYNFADPDDPSRSRQVSLPNHIARLQAKEGRAGKTTRAVLQSNVTQYIQSGVNMGQIHSREDVLSAIDKAGMTVVRIGKDYITIKDPNANTRIRLRGSFFRADFSHRSTDVNRDINQPSGRDLKIRQENIEKQLRRLTETRAKYNSTTYGTSSEKKPSKGMSLDSYVRKALGTEVFPHSQPDQDHHDHTGTTSSRRARTDGNRTSKEQSSHGDALGRIGEASDAWSGACRRLDQARDVAIKDHQGLNREARTIKSDWEKMTEASREKKQIEAIFTHYGIYSSGRDTAAQRGHQRERER